MAEFELVTLKSGIKSLRALKNLETFHPVTGPRMEAGILHVRQPRLFERAAASAPPFVIWDVGFGAAANVLTAIEALRESTAEIEIHSFDHTIAPIKFALKHSSELGYLVPHESDLRSLLHLRDITLRPGLRWRLHLSDFGELLASATPLPSPHAIFYDPYSPSGNPEMWSLDHFRLLRSRLSDDVPCLMTNYTCSTAVRVTLLLAGFHVGRGCGVGEKRETTIVSNRLELLERPLRSDWFKTVRISHAAAPLGASPAGPAPISPEDFERLSRLEQFRQ
ncbi:MAG: hypothetical protein HY075_08540 [Deltaproteobacteria bacterium]|nr:hypothetical protein [Deltaproteobacteria bacterium]